MVILLLAFYCLQMMYKIGKTPVMKVLINGVADVHDSVSESKHALWSMSEGLVL